MGMLERGGNVRAFVVDNRRKKELQKHVREHVEAGSAIFSDELKSYEGLESDYQHAVINHAVEYVNGNVHTNAHGKLLESSEARPARNLHQHCRLQCGARLSVPLWTSVHGPPSAS